MQSFTPEQRAVIDARLGALSIRLASLARRMDLVTAAPAQPQPAAPPAA